MLLDGSRASLARSGRERNRRPTACCGRKRARCRERGVQGGSEFGEQDQLQLIEETPEEGFHYCKNIDTYVPMIPPAIGAVQTLPRPQALVAACGSRLATADCATYGVYMQDVDGAYSKQVVACLDLYY